MPIPSYNTVSVNLRHLRWNYRRLAELAGPDVVLLPMVKADAYGHGLVPCARALAECGARCFGVAEVDEGVALRRAGISGDIIVFLGANQYDALIAYNLSPVVFDAETIRAVGGHAAARQATVGVHLKIDVGMGRLGALPADVPELVKLVERQAGVRLAGVLAHFPMADQGDRRRDTEARNSVFLRLLEDCGIAGDAVAHIANSAAAIRYPATRLGMVRPGIALYGLYPSADDEVRRALELRPVMRFTTRVLQVKDVPAGYGVSYGHVFVTEKPSRLAILPVGYADGYLRGLSDRGHVLIGGGRAPVRGRVCMNATIVDVSALDGRVSPGDEVVLMGRQEAQGRVGEISADEIAAWMGTISYEVLCLFGNSNAREYIG